MYNVVTGIAFGLIYYVKQQWLLFLIGFIQFGALVSCFSIIHAFRLMRKITKTYLFLGKWTVLSLVISYGTYGVSVLLFSFAHFSRSSFFSESVMMIS